MPAFAILDVGGPEIMIILLVALLLFGSQRLPELARNLGKSLREFKKATAGLEAELRRAMDESPRSPSPRVPTVPAAPAAAPTAAVPPPTQDNPPPAPETPVDP